MSNVYRELCNPHDFLMGKVCIPCGFVPLAERIDDGALIGVDPSGTWRAWLPGSAWAPLADLGAQRSVFLVLTAGRSWTSAKLAQFLDVSARTVEAWRSGRVPLPCKSAYEIFSHLLACA